MERMSDTFRIRFVTDGIALNPEMVPPARRRIQTPHIRQAVLSACALLCMMSCTTISGHQQKPSPVAHALDGTPLYPPPEPAAVMAAKDTLVVLAAKKYKEDSTNLDNIIWYGRMLANAYRYPEAIAVYTKGLERFPDAPALLRHRGHRYITTRRFDAAIADLSRAAMLIKGKPVELEQDITPNQFNTPLTTLQFNIWYHLGLAYYLKGDNVAAAIAYDSCMHYSTDPDMLCATADWDYLTLMRLGNTAAAKQVLDTIYPGMDVLENGGYLTRLLMYKGIISPGTLVHFEDTTAQNQLTVVTQGYGVASYLMQQGDSTKGRELLREILKTQYWPAFGYIAAEADVHRGL